MSVLWRIYLLVTLFFVLVTILGLALLLRQASEDVQREGHAAEAVVEYLYETARRDPPVLSRQEGISQATLYAWRTKLKAGGAVVPGDKKNADDWPAEAKFAAVLHAATLSEIELSEYCRSKGLYPEQISAWRQACITGQISAKAQLKVERE